MNFFAISVKFVYIGSNVYKHRSESDNDQNYETYPPIVESSTRKISVVQKQ